MNVRIDLNEPKILAKVQNDRFGTLVSTEAKRLYDPYTPRDTGTMQDTATLNPWQIHYKQKYAERVYYEARPEWNKMVERAMNADYSWDVSAKKYEEMYNELIDQK